MERFQYQWCLGYSIDKCFLLSQTCTLYSQFRLRLMDALQLDLQVSLTRILLIAGSESCFSLTFKAELGKPDRFRPEILSSNIHHLNISFSGYTVIKRAQYKGFAPSSKIILDFFAWHYACTLHNRYLQLHNYK